MNGLLLAAAVGASVSFARPVPEHPAKYPENTMFDWQMLPAFAFYVRHADGIRLENVRWRTLRPDERKPLVQEDADVTLINDNAALIHVGAPLKYLGKRCFAFSTLDPSFVPGIMARVP